MSTVKFLLPLFILMACNAKEKSVAITALERKDGMILIPSGKLSMGGDGKLADPNEFPKHDVKIASFWMDETEVTNTQFKAFVTATSYVTLAERPVKWEEMKKQLPPNTPRPHDSLLAPGSLVFTPTTQAVPLNNPGYWWRWTIGANWQHPTGPNSSISEIMDHPVTQIAYDDAIAYCTWAQKRLPTEAEWEWAARGGKNNMVYPWGNDELDENQPPANFYQGLFPYHNTLKDGFDLTSPVKTYKPNGYGLYDMAGNVWEWCNDWFDFEYYKSKTATDPLNKGPQKSYNPSMPYQQERVIRGGSFLCNESYCSGYRNARRMGSTADTGLNHTGFRCVKDVKSK
jgi:formylglycine-generating enzyme